MSRFVVVIDWSSRMELSAALDRAREIMTLGGSRERAFTCRRPPFGALVLSHRDEPPRELPDGSIALAGGYGASCDERAEFLRGCRAALAASGGEPRPPGGDGAPMPAFPAGPSGRRSYVHWSPAARRLLIVAEPHGLEPVYLFHDAGRTVLASEVKGIWALAASDLAPDSDALLDLYAVGHCLHGRTPLRPVRCLEPGTAHLLGEGGAARGATWHRPRLEEGRDGDPAAEARALNRRVVEVLRAYRPAAPRVSVALSGGLDSRYVLAAARTVWEGLDAFTFGEPGSQDVVTARRLAARARVPHREYRASERFLPDWAAYAVWRTDGQVSCLHAHGMDAVVEHSGRTHDLLNGICGDVALGSFLRPSHLGPTGGADRVARQVLAARRFHDRTPGAIWKPEVLARATAPPAEETLRELVRGGLHERFGNTLLAYWLRWYVPRSTVLGLALETPFVEHWGPLADPDFLVLATRLPLESRFLCRAYRRALAQLAPSLTHERWGRVGLAPRWPWPALALGRAAIRFGLLPRPRPALDFSRALRSTWQPWLREILLGDETRADGYFLPGYLEEIVSRHARGEADHAPEIGMALTVELWRRLFVAGRTELARNPGAPPR